MSGEMEKASDDDESEGTPESISREELNSRKRKAVVEGSASPKSEDYKPSSGDDLPTVTESTLERRKKRRRELNRLSKMRRRKHRKEVAATLEQEVSRLTAEYNTLREENDELRREWDQCLHFQQQQRVTPQVGTRFTPTRQSTGIPAQLAHTAFSQPMANLARPFLDSNTAMLQLMSQQQQQSAHFGGFPLYGSAVPTNPNRLGFPLVASVGENLGVPPARRDGTTGSSSWMTASHAPLGALSAQQALAQWQIQHGSDLSSVYRTVQGNLTSTERHQLPSLSQPSQDESDD